MNRIDKVKYFMLGVIVSLIISVGIIPAIAASISKQVTAFYNNISIVIDGTEITPKDATGAIVEPFIIDGTTYLPVRAVCEAIGKDVEWDGSTQTVYVGGKTEKVAKDFLMYDRPYIECSDPSRFKSESGGGYAYTGFKSNPDNTVDNTDGSETSVQYVVYPLNGVAKNISGVFMPGIFYDRATYMSSGKSGSQTVFRFYNESGKLLYQSPIMTSSTAETKFEFDVTGAISLKIEVEHTADPYDRYYGNDNDNFIKDLTITTTDY